MNQRLKAIASYTAHSLTGKRALERKFFNAVKEGHAELVASLVKSGVDPNAVDEERHTALHILAEKGDVPVAKVVLTHKNTLINAQSATGDTPLIKAVAFQRIKFAGFLLQNGANPNVKNEFGKTALHVAVSKKNLDMVHELLFYKASTNISDVYGSTPLSLSVIEFHNRKISADLLKMGADPNLRTIRPNPLLLEFCLNCRDEAKLKTLQLLINNKADINIVNNTSKHTALHIASLTGYLPLVKVLLKNGADPNLRDVLNRTPYLMALEHENMEIVNFYKQREKTVKKMHEVVQEAREKRRTKLLLESLSHSQLKTRLSIPKSVKFSNESIKKYF